MNAYLILKWLHILSSVVLVGTGFGSAFYMFFTNRSGNLAAQVIVSRLVVKADKWLTLPTVIIQPVTGLLLMHMAGWSMTVPWLLISAVLFAVAGMCWLPVLWLQIRMAELATDADQTGRTLPTLYWIYAAWWERLGYIAFTAMVGVFFFMVNKPSIWGI